MPDIIVKAEQRIDKRYIEAAAIFAINHLPQVDETTLTKFVDLINITGNFNAISHGRLIKKMNLLIHLVPGICKYSLCTLVELLDIYVPMNNSDEVNALWGDLNEQQQAYLSALGRFSRPPLKRF